MASVFWIRISEIAVATAGKNILGLKQARCVKMQITKTRVKAKALVTAESVILLRGEPSSGPSRRAAPIRCVATVSHVAHSLSVTSGMVPLVLAARRHHTQRVAVASGPRWDRMPAIRQPGGGRDERARVASGRMPAGSSVDERRASCPRGPRPLRTLRGPATGRTGRSGCPRDGRARVRVRHRDATGRAPRVGAGGAGARDTRGGLGRIGRTGNSAPAF